MATWDNQSADPNLRNDIGHDPNGSANAVLIGNQTPVIVPHAPPKYDTIDDLAVAAQVSALQPANGRVSLIGDSMAVGNAPVYASGNPRFGTSLSHNWLVQLCIASRGRLRYDGAYATGGYTLEQIRTVHLPSVLAKSPAPGACFIHGVGNDLIGGASDGASFVFANAVASWRSIVASLIANGIAPIAMTVAPFYGATTTHPTIRNNTFKWNSWIRQECDRRGIMLVDYYSAVTDIQGGYKTGLDSGDAVHPNGAGYKVISDKIINDGLLHAFPPGSTRNAKSGYDGTNLWNAGGINAGIFATDANSDGLADGGLTATGTGLTCSLVNPTATDRIGGKWQQLARAASSTGQATINCNPWTTGFSVGDILEFSSDIQTENMVAAGTSWTYGILLQAVTDASEVFMGVSNYAADIDYLNNGGGNLSFQFQVPVGGAGMYWYAAINANPHASLVAKLRLGELTIRNLTTGAAFA